MGVLYCHGIKGGAVRVNAHKKIFFSCKIHGIPPLFLLDLPEIIRYDEENKNPVLVHKGVNYEHIGGCAHVLQCQK